MAERTYFCYCDDNCRFETLTREQILTAITQAVNEGTIGDIDTGFVTTIKTINGSSLRFFVGTQSEYEKLSEDERQNLFAVITNDTTKDGILTALETMGADVEDLQQAVEENKTAIAENTSAIATNTANIATNAAAIATNKTNISKNASGISTNKTNIATNTTKINRLNTAAVTKDIGQGSAALTKASYYYIEVKKSSATNYIFPLGLIYWKSGIYVRKKFGYVDEEYSFNLMDDGTCTILQGNSDVTDEFIICVNQWGA